MDELWFVSPEEDNQRIREAMARLATQMALLNVTPLPRVQGLTRRPYARPITAAALARDEGGPWDCSMVCLYHATVVS